MPPTWNPLTARRPGVRATAARQQGFINPTPAVNVQHDYIFPSAPAYTPANRATQRASAQQAINFGRVTPNPNVTVRPAPVQAAVAKAKAKVRPQAAMGPTNPFANPLVSSAYTNYANPYAQMQKLIGPILSQQQIQTQGSNYVDRAIDAQLADERASAALEQRQIGNQATRANEFAKALGLVTAQDPGNIQNAYMQAAQFQQGLGTGLTGAVADAQQQAADQASAQISQMTGGLANQVGGYNIPAERSVAQLTGTVMPARNLAEEAANASTLASFQRGANVNQIGAIARDYLTKATDAAAAAAAERAKIIAMRPDLTDKQVQALQQNRTNQVSQLMNLAQGTLAYHNQLNQAKNQASSQVLNWLNSATNRQVALGGLDINRANLGISALNAATNRKVSLGGLDINRANLAINAQNAIVNQKVALSNADVQALNSDVNRQVALKNAATSALNAATSVFTAKGNQKINYMNALRQWNSAKTYDSYLNSKIGLSQQELDWKKQYDKIQIKLTQKDQDIKSLYNAAQIGLGQDRNATAKMRAALDEAGLTGLYQGKPVLGTWKNPYTGKIEKMPSGTIIGKKGLPIDATPAAAAAKAKAKVKIPTVDEIGGFRDRMLTGARTRFNPPGFTAPTLVPRKTIVNYLMSQYGSGFLISYPSQKKYVRQAVESAAGSIIAEINARLKKAGK